MPRYKIFFRSLDLLFGLVVIVIVFSSCHSRQNKKTIKHRVISTAADSREFAEKLSTIFSPVDTDGGKKLQTISDNMHYAYELHEYAPLWLSHGKPNRASELLLSELDSIRWDGIDPERYHLSMLKELRANLGDTAGVLKQIAYDTAFSCAYMKAAQDLLMGEVLPSTADSLWFHTNDSTWHAPEELAKGSNDFPSLNIYRSRMPTYKLLRNEYKFYYTLQSDSELLDAIAQVPQAQLISHPDSSTKASIAYIIRTELPWINEDTFGKALRTYQYYMDISVSGKLDSFTLARLSRTPQQIMQPLKANMERIRWTQQDYGDLYIIVDVPQMELFFRKDGQDVMRMHTVVGKPERQTPSLLANMANVVINPPWGVPPTIMKKDVLPGMSKSGIKYLKKKGLKVYNHDGDLVDPSRVNESNYKRYVFKQAPGDDNSLGYVKFNMPNKWDIYLHDTPHRDDFQRRNRFLSSGCIRLQKPLDMAIYILSDLEKRRYTPERLDSVIQTHKTRWEVLKTRIPVHVLYLTNFEDTTGSHIRYIRDIYHRDDKLEALLK